MHNLRSYVWGYADSWCGLWYSAVLQVRHMCNICARY